MNFDSELFEEYNSLKKALLQDQEILQLIETHNALNAKLRDLDPYCDAFKNVKLEYDKVSSELLSNEMYVAFKELEREINLFVMYCNLELKKLFDLDEKGCAK